MKTKYAFALAACIGACLFANDGAQAGCSYNDLLKSRGELLNRRQMLEQRLYEAQTNVSDLKSRINRWQARVDFLQQKLDRINAATKELDEAIAVLP